MDTSRLKAKFNQNQITSTVSSTFYHSNLEDELSKPEDPDAWKYRPFSKFGSYSTTSAMNLPQRIMSELRNEEEY